MFQVNQAPISTDGLVTKPVNKDFFKLSHQITACFTFNSLLLMTHFYEIHYILILTLNILGEQQFTDYLKGL